MSLRRNAGKTSPLGSFSGPALDELPSPSSLSLWILLSMRVSQISQARCLKVLTSFKRMVATRSFLSSSAVCAGSVVEVSLTDYREKEASVFGIAAETGRRRN